MGEVDKQIVSHLLSAYYALSLSSLCYEKLNPFMPSGHLIREVFGQVNFKKKGYLVRFELT